MSEIPFISFVIPTKNRIEWLGEAVYSLLSQSEENIEIIIVNDASTDGTKEFLEEWLGGNPRVKIIHNETSQGAGVSRNLGTNAASAEIVCQFDDDDISVDDRAARTIQWFKDHPASELVNFPYCSIGYFNEIKDAYDGSEFDENIFKENGEVTYFCNPSVAYKKDAFLQTDGYQKENEKETDDYGFVRNWIKAGKKIDFDAGDPVILHRILPDSMMSKLRGWDEEWVK